VALVLARNNISKHQLGTGSVTVPAKSY